VRVGFLSVGMCGPWQRWEAPLLRGGSHRPDWCARCAGVRVGAARRSHSAVRVGAGLQNRGACVAKMVSAARDGNLHGMAILARICLALLCSADAHGSWMSSWMMSPV
jgi:hypothetical protein